LDRVLYLPSTPLNILMSASHAVHFASEQVAQVWLIDQAQAEPNIYTDILNAWPESPFQQVKQFEGGAGFKKLSVRKNNFKEFEVLLSAFKPNTLAVGSDRRIEFQYIWHYLILHGQNPLKSLYLDDGLYTYSGRSSSVWKDGFNSLLKKWVYGQWWEEPVTVGASSKINQAWLFLPELAKKEIVQDKQVICFQAEWLQSDEILSLSRNVMEAFSENILDYQTIDILWFLPHPDNAAKMQNYVVNVKVAIQSLINKGYRVAVKYHPRVTEKDPFNLAASQGVSVIPHKMASEFILPALSAETRVMGDVGTAMLTCKWLRPDIDVMAFLSETDPFQAKFIPLMRKMGIRIEQISAIGETI